MNGETPMISLVAALAFLAIQASDHPAERTVVVPSGTKPFNVKQDVIVRFTVSAYAGSQISAKLDGPAKIEAENTIVELYDGRPNKGAVAKEFEVKPSGKGKVKLDVTITPPQPGSDSTIKHFVFNVD
jgi:hypothetical protein